MNYLMLPALAGSIAVSPALAQDMNSPSALKAVQAATRSATVQPVATGFVSGSQIYPFREGTIYQVYAAPGLVTDIALQPGENLVAVASGDTARWVIGDTTSGSGEGKQTHVLVKPFSAGLLTNLVITTDRRAYHVRLVSTGGTALFSMRWSYPEEELLALRRKAEMAQATAPIATGLSIEALHFNYAIRGDRPAWRPLRVFDDGSKTYVEFPASLATGEVPPLFVIGGDGKVELVNYRLRERFYVIDRIFDAAELRLGTKKQQVVRINRVSQPAQRRGE